MAAARLLYLARPSLHIMNTMRYVKIHSSRRNTYSLHRFYLIPHCVSYTLHFLITRAPLPPLRSRVCSFVATKVNGQIQERPEASYIYVPFRSSLICQKYL